MSKKALFLGEIVERVRSEPEKSGKVNALRENDNDVLREFLMLLFDPAVEFLLPETPPPHTPNPAPIGLSDTGLHREMRVLRKIFTNQGVLAKPEHQGKRETKFILLLESLSVQEAKLLLELKCKEVPGISWELVEAAFPGKYPQPANYEKPKVNNWNGFKSKPLVEVPQVPSPETLPPVDPNWIEEQKKVAETSEIPEDGKYKRARQKRVHKGPPPTSDLSVIQQRKARKSKEQEKGERDPQTGRRKALHRNKKLEKLAEREFWKTAMDRVKPFVDRGGYFKKDAEIPILDCIVECYHRYVLSRLPSETEAPKVEEEPIKIPTKAADLDKAGPPGEGLEVEIAKPVGTLSDEETKELLGLF